MSCKLMGRSMQLARSRAWFILTLLLAIPGCRRVADWSKCVWHKREDVRVDIDAARKYVRSVPVYNELTTLAIFDVMLLSDEVRELYAKVNGVRRTRGPDQVSLFLKRQLEQNCHCVAFYVLSLHEVVLAHEHPEWRIVLKIGNKLFHPTSVKLVTMPMEYKHFFGSRYTRFKSAYEVIFDANDAQGNPIVTAGTNTLTMEFYSVDKSVSTSWDITRPDITLEGDCS